MPIQINNVPRRVVYAASGTGPYAFTFEILAAGDIAVYRDDTLLTITTDYTVTIASNGTGSITLTAAPTGATQIAIVGNRTIQRTTDFTTGGDFFANTLNDELDQQTIFAQQNAEGLARALTAPQTDPTTINMTLPRASERANKYLAFDADGNPQPGDTAVEVAAIASIADEIEDVAAIDAQVVTVAGISSNVTTVAGISSAVSGVAAISSAVSGVNSNSANINTVAGQISPTNNISTVAGIAGNITTVAGIAADVTAVAGVDSADLGAVADIAADVTTVAGIAGDVAAVENIAANVTTVAGISGNVTTVAGISSAVSNVSSISSAVSGVNSNSSNINTVAGISANVTTVAGISSNVTTVATNNANVSTVAGISANVTSVAGNSTNINAVAGNATNINAVAGNATNINAVAGIAADVTTVATNVADVTNFADVYIGPKTSNPTQRNDTTALQTGDLYFNTVANEMRIYNGSAWQTTATLPDLIVEYEFTATAGQTSYTFSGGYRVGFTYVWVNGVMLSDADITATDGSTITFGTALNLNDEVRVITFKAVGSITATDVGALPLTGGTLTGPTIVSVNSSSDALRITQTGAGNALVVEDSTNPDSTPFVVDANGRVFVGAISGYSTGGLNPGVQVNGTGGISGFGSYNWSSTGSEFASLNLSRSMSNTVGTQAAVTVDQAIGIINFNGSDGTGFIRAAQIIANVDGTPGTNDMPGRLVFSTTADGASSPTERMRIDSAGNVGIGGASFAGVSFRNTKSITGATSAFANFTDATVSSGVTSIARGYSTYLTTQAASFTLPTLSHYEAASNTFGAGSTVTNQFGFIAQSSLTGATNNYGFYSNIASGTGRWNFYANGTAASYFGGDVQFKKAIVEEVYTITDGAAFEIDPSNGTMQLITLGASRTPKATNFANGESVTLMVDDGSAYTLTWSDSTFGGSGVVWKTNAGVAPTLNTTGYTVITLWKVGGQVYGARVGDA